MTTTPTPLALAIQTERESTKTLRRLLQSPLSVLGLLIVGLVIAVSIGAPLLTPYDPVKGNISTSYVKAPSIAHPFGTDDAGRDIFSRVIYGGRISLRIALLAEAFGLIVGTVVGLLTGYYGGWLDSVLMRVVDIFMAFPLLIIAIGLAAALGPSEGNLILTLGLVIWPFVARLVRGQVLTVREGEYIAAARVIGVRDRGIIFRHILPNILTPLIVYGTLGVANIILQEAALSFLGLGSADRSAPSWGRMLNDSREFLLAAPWMAFYPGLAIVIIVLGLNLLGDGLQDALDIRAG